MNFSIKLVEKTGIEKEKLPNSYQIIGDVLLVKMLRLNDEEKGKTALAIKELLPYVKTVCELSLVDGELREPEVRKLLGGNTETTHKENGILYKLDVEKVMFSKGNKFERQRLAEQVKENETVVDMFAGIGYFTLPMAKKAKKVVAIEKNPTAFGYLEENIILNKLENVEAINNDNRDIELEEVADRVMMGYFPGTEKFLPYAIKMLKKKGTIHYHNVCHNSDEWGKDATDFLTSEGINFTVIKREVKTVGPRMVHFVLDLEIKK